VGEGSGSAADETPPLSFAGRAPVADEWVPFFDDTATHEPRPLALAGLEAAGAPPPGGVAVELGCGGGLDTIALLRAGWTVHAMDASPEGVRRTLARAADAGFGDRLTAEQATFEEYDVPAADFLYAGYSLPFCHPDSFPRVWEGLLAALRPGGALAVNLFGVHDTWAGTPGMNFHTRDQVLELIADLDLIQLDEEDEDGDSLAGPKHWHVFDVLARRPPAG
jgi:SAM-dependent methyltransferase